MKTNTIVIALVGAAVLTTSCASKKELENCQLENKQLTTDYQQSKEQLAASQARVTSLEEQLNDQKRAYATRNAPTQSFRTRSTRALPMLRRTM